MISIVACLMPEMGLGFQGALPWRLAKEMRYFKQTTTSTFKTGAINAVVMGRKTWESIPQKFRPLPNRLNVIVSRNFPDTCSADETNKLVYHSNSLSGAIESLKSSSSELGLERIYIIGGGEIYNQSFPIVDHWLITELQNPRGAQIPPMDTFLDIHQLKSQYSDHSSELRRFVPQQVELPLQNNNGQISDQEKGFEFNYKLYSRK